MDDLIDSVYSAISGATDLIAAPTRPGARVVIRRIVVSVALAAALEVDFTDLEDNTLYPLISIADTATVPIYDSGLMEYRLPPNKGFKATPGALQAGEILVQYSLLG